MTRSERLEEIRRRHARLLQADCCLPDTAMDLAAEDIPWLLSELEKTRAEAMEDARRQLADGLKQLAQTGQSLAVAAIVRQCAEAVGDFPLNGPKP